MFHDTIAVEGGVKIGARIVEVFLKKYALSTDYRNNFFDDLMQAARFALYQALKSFDMEKAANANDSFWAYAKMRVKGSIKDGLSRNIGAVHAPLSTKQLALQHFVKYSGIPIKCDYLLLTSCKEGDSFWTTCKSNFN